MVRIVKPGERDKGTAQTPGMQREAGISPATSASEGLWMGFVQNAPGASSGAHHHGDAESGIYIVQGRIRFRWGAKLEHEAIAEPGDFVFVPPMEVHLEENLGQDEPAQFVVARNSTGMIVVNVPDPREA